MTTEAPALVRVPFRYAHEHNPAGLFYALAHSQSTCSFQEHDTEVVDGRPISHRCALDTTGFVLVRHETAVTDFTDTRQVDDVYVPEVEALVQRLTGASRVIVFHKLARFEGGEAEGRRQPARNPHVDYTQDSFETWIRQELGPDEAEPLLAKRWSAINVWRGIRPVERAPLALADGRTVLAERLLPVQIHEAPGKPTPFVGINLRYDPAQHWYFFPDMQPDEALVFTLFDTDPDRTQRVAHSAFDDPGSRPDAAPRASFEVRTVAFFD